MRVWFAAPMWIPLTAWGQRGQRRCHGNFDWLPQIAPPKSWLTIGCRPCRDKDPSLTCLVLNTVIFLAELQDRHDSWPYGAKRGWDGGAVNWWNVCPAALKPLGWSFERFCYIWNSAFISLVCPRAPTSVPSVVSVWMMAAFPSPF